jgi:16S rRNA (cytidine1402-2'-O)-methyltransferase
MPGKLFIVATPIGNAADFGERALSVLREVSLIAVEDTRHSGRLFQTCGITTPLMSCHDYNEKERVDQLLGRLKLGEDIALVSDAGTPLVSDPGFVLVRAAHAEGIKVVPVPGASAVVTALCCAGLPTDRFVFEGFLPSKATARQKRLEDMAAESRTMVFYEAPHRIVECLQDMMASFGAERPATLARELTKTYETIIPATLDRLREIVISDENQQKGEIVLVVGGAVGGVSEEEQAATATLRILMEELSISQASALAAKLTGLKKNHLYELALQIRGAVPPAEN